VATVLFPLRRRMTLVAGLVVACVGIFPALANADASPGATLTAGPATLVNPATAPAAPARGLPAGASIDRPTVSAADYAAAKSAAARAPRGTKPGAPSTPSNYGPIGILSNTNGENQNDAGGFFPPDVNGAVGGSWVGEITNVHFLVYSKASPSTVLMNVSLNAFFGYANQQLFDPRVIYDPVGRRWVASAVAFPENTSVQILCIAASKTYDPTGSWFRYCFNVTFFTGDFFDYPQLGQNQDGIIITGNIFNSGGAFTGADTFGVSKMIIYNGQGFSTPVFIGQPGTLTPPQVHDQNPTAFMIANCCTSTQLTLLAFHNPGNGFYGGLTSATVAVAGYAIPPNAPQPGTSDLIDTSDTRFVNQPSQYGTDLWAVHGIACFGSFSCPRWYQLNTQTNAVTQSGLPFFSGTSFDYNPSLQAQQGSPNRMDMTWSASDSSLNPSMILGKHLSTDPAGSTTIALGFTSPSNLTGDFDPNFGAERWGDTSFVALDPASSSAVWAFNEAVQDTNTWRDRIIKFQ
jgi:hypothetical protein